MNKVVLIGRLTADADARVTQDGNGVASFTLAVDRRAKKDSQNNADFIRCVAFGNTAEAIEKYTHKGSKIAVEGRIQTGSYKDKEGRTVYTTDIMVESFEFCESKSAEKPQSSNDGWASIPDVIEEELPFM